jgi:beta-lactam-binding protein with PASTA domain
MSLLKRLNIKRLSKHLVLAIVLFFALVFIGLFSLSFFTNHGEQIEVPDLRNKTEVEFSEILKDLDLRYVILDSGAFNPKIKPTGVIDQNPIAGSGVKQNRKIYLTINPSSPGFTDLADYKDMHIRRLVSACRATQLNIERLEFKKDIANCVVLDVQHNGKSLKEGETIGKGSFLTVTLGKAPGRHTSIPNVKNNNLNHATDKILSNGLNIGVVRIDEEDKFLPESELVVYKQDPVGSKASIYSLGRGVNLWLRKRESKN